MNGGWDVPGGCLGGWEQGIGVHMIKHTDGLYEAVKE